MGNDELKQDFFGSNRNVTTASAPGRMDVMGGIADYSGSLLLEMPIAEQTHVSVVLREDQQVRVFSSRAREAGLPEMVEISLEKLYSDANLFDYNHVRETIKAKPGGAWAVYVLGCLVHLLNTKNISGKGLDIFVESEVPFGKGVSSSAALEVATMKAITTLFKVKMDAKEIPVMCQQVENRIVGAPCGLMDQLTSYFGETNKLLPIVCQPDQTYLPVDIPEGVHFVGIDSGVKHAVSGASYSNVRKAAFMGYTIIALQEGADFKDLEIARKAQKWENLPYGGYLANIPAEKFRNKYFNNLPETMGGAAFLNKYKLTIDPVTDIDSKETYYIKDCAGHPVFENERVNQFLNILQHLNKGFEPENTERLLNELGEQMYGAHQSYSKCGLGNPYTDELVDEVKARGANAGLYGARVTGGGNGGTVCILAYNEKGEAAAREIAARYGKKYNMHVSFFSGSSDGANRLKPSEWVS